MTTAEAIRMIAKHADEVYSQIGVVESVDEDTRTCVCSLVDSRADVYGVRLQAKLGIADGFLVVPKVGSTVVLTFIDQDTAYLALASQVDRIEVVVDDQTMIVSSEGLHLSSGQATLKEVFGSLIDEFKALIDTVKLLQLGTPSGPTTGVLPTSLTALDQHKVAADQIKNNANSFLHD